MDKASKINVDSVSIIILIVSVSFLEHKKSQLDPSSFVFCLQQPRLDA